MEEDHSLLEEAYREDHDEAATAAAAEADGAAGKKGKNKKSRPLRSSRGASQSSSKEKAYQKPSFGNLGRTQPATSKRKKRAEAQYGDSFAEGYEQHDEGKKEEEEPLQEGIKAARMGGGGRNDLEDMVEAKRQQAEEERQQEQAKAAEASPEEELRRAAMDDGEGPPVMSSPPTLRSPIEKAAWQAMMGVSKGLWQVRRFVVRSFNADTRRVVHALRCGRRGDHYCVLNLQANPVSSFFDLDRKPSDKAVKKAYKKLALQLHPDKNRHPKAKVAFDLLQNAYETLRDDDKHRQFRIQRSLSRERRRRRVLYSAQSLVENSWLVLKSLVVGDLIILLFLALLFA
uniref:J domain-containing protein n=1 Tax=Pinguiococcus pyrenoidosus TaxID=172671 RepID=A0A7R9U5C8_9STRA